VVTASDLNPMVVTANLIGFENREVAGLDQTGIFLHGAFNGPVDGNSIAVEFFQGAVADAPHHDPIHLAPPRAVMGLQTPC
jgi:hypothetical protein